jgi:phytoene dehydrogenase-like protein
MDERADIVVAGAGHNSLIAACYLAKAGYRCLVLDARHVPGGGATTEEILLPGYGIDTCATGHTLIRVNPLLTGDELGLIADYGLRYIDPDPVAHVAFPDGEQLTMWLDRDRTAVEIARFSAADAAAYLRLLDEYDEVKSVFSGSQFTPVGFGPSLDARLAEHPRGRLWQRRRALSAWDVIRHEFGSRHVRAFMLWMAFQTNQAVDVPGSGVLAYSLIFGRQQRSWSILAGGSGRLAEALTGYLRSHGSTVLCDKRVTRLLLDGDRCAGVETADGGQYRAGKAVLSTIHVTQLRDMAPARAWPEEFHYGIDTYDVGIPGFGVYLATSAPPEFAAPDGGSQTAVSAGTVGWPEDVIRLGQDLRAGRFVADVPWLLVATPTLADPTRAPSGKHTVKLLSQQVYELPAGMPGWDVVKAEHAKRQLEHLRLSAPGFTDDVILAQLVKSPADYEQLNPHMVHGAFHGGDRGVAQTGSLRPVPGWASHRMPIAGLYQTGATTHPGGSITGAPGRNAAIVLLHDLGHDPAEVMGALRTMDRASIPVGLDGVFRVVGDQVVVDRCRGGEAGGGGADDLGLDVGHVACDPDTRLGRGASGAGLDLSAQQVPVQAHLTGQHAERCQQLGAGPADRRHDERVQLDAAAVGEPNTGQPAGGGVDLGHDSGGYGDAQGCELFLLLGCRWRPGVLQQGDLGAELAKH